MMKKMYLLYCCLYCAGFSWAQINNHIAQLKVSEDNDFLNFRGEGTDRGYTSGMTIGYSVLKNKIIHFPSNILLRINDNAQNVYGWSITQLLYTPNNITSDEIQYHDRPYAGVLYISRSLISSNAVTREKLSSSISFGTIGRYSFGAQMQTMVHRMIHYDKPAGWDNQVSTDVIINYRIMFEKLLRSATRNFEVIGSLGGNAGTFQNNISTGIQFRAGKLNSYFSGREGLSDGKPRFFFYMKTGITCVMDDASLQGGFFAHHSPYTIPKDSISRVVVNYEYGFAIAARHFGIRAAEQMQTREFHGTYTQQTGNITLYFEL